MSKPVDVLVTHLKTYNQIWFHHVGKLLITDKTARLYHSLIDSTPFRTIDLEENTVQVVSIYQGDVR